MGLLFRNALRPMKFACILGLFLVLPLLLFACGGGGGGEGPTATPSAAETPTRAPTVQRPTPTQGVRTPAAASPAAEINWGDVITAEEADVALGERVTTILPGTRYSHWQTDSGSYLRIQPGPAQDLQPGAEIEGVAGEPVAGVGEGAVWFDGVRGPSEDLEFADETVTLRILSVRQSEVYFRIILNLPERDSAAQFEIAKGLAAKVIDRLP